MQKSVGDNVKEVWAHPRKSSKARQLHSIAWNISLPVHTRHPIVRNNYTLIVKKGEQIAQSTKIFPSPGKKSTRDSKGYLVFSTTSLLSCCRYSRRRLGRSESLWFISADCRRLRCFCGLRLRLLRKHWSLSSLCFLSVSIDFLCLLWR